MVIITLTILTFLLRNSSAIPLPSLPEFDQLRQLTKRGHSSQSKAEDWWNTAFNKISGYEKEAKEFLDDAEFVFSETTKFSDKWINSADYQIESSSSPMLYEILQKDIQAYQSMIQSQPVVQKFVFKSTRAYAYAEEVWDVYRESRSRLSRASRLRGALDAEEEEFLGPFKSLLESSKALTRKFDGLEMAVESKLLYNLDILKEHHQKLKNGAQVALEEFINLIKDKTDTEQDKLRDLFEETEKKVLNFQDNVQRLSKMLQDMNHFMEDVIVFASERLSQMRAYTNSQSELEFYSSLTKDAYSKQKEWMLIYKSVDEEANAALEMTGSLNAFEKRSFDKKMMTSPRNKPMSVDKSLEKTRLANSLESASSVGPLPMIKSFSMH